MGNASAVSRSNSRVESLQKSGETNLKRHNTTTTKEDDGEDTDDDELNEPAHIMGKMKRIMNDNVKRNEFVSYLSNQGKSPYIRCFQDLELFRRQLIQQQQQLLQSCHPNDETSTMKVTIPYPAKYFHVSKHHHHHDPSHSSSNNIIMQNEIKENIAECLKPLIELRDMFIQNTNHEEEEVEDDNHHLDQHNHDKDHHHDLANAHSLHHIQQITKSSVLETVNTDRVCQSLLQTDTSLIAMTSISCIQWIDMIMLCQDKLLSCLCIHVDEFLLTSSTTK